MSDNCLVARRILSDLNSNIVPKVKRNKEIVEEFLDKLQELLRRPSQGAGDVISVDIMHGGSAYESLSVSEKVDFDIAVVLGEPFISENFDINRDPYSGYFTLKWKSHLANKRKADANGYLKASELKSHLFGGLKSKIQELKLPNVVVTCKDGLSALIVKIKYYTGLEISMDLVPQIACRTWGQCPDLKPLGEMPASLRQYIDTLNRNKSPIMFFSLGISRAERYSNADLLFNASFTMLEKDFLRSHTDLRDMVRLVKVVAEHREWKKFYFKSFHAKRMAVKHCGQLHGKDLWEGYKALLSFIFEEIYEGTMDGYFVKNQIVQEWQPRQVQEFRKEIAEVYKMGAREFM